MARKNNTFNQNVIPAFEPESHTVKFNDSNDGAIADQVRNDVNMDDELEALKRENFNLKVLSQLDKAGCLKSDLVSKSVPLNCEDIPKWVEEFKTNNEILFQQPPKSFGGTFKPASANVLSPKEVMNEFIRNSRR